MNKKEILCYETDASRLIGKAEKIVFPKKVEEIQNIAKTTHNIVLRGAGTSLNGGSIPDNSLVIDINKMSRLIDFDKNKKVVYVEAGICIKELNEKLNAIGFEFPVQPINEASTLCGMTAINVSNSRSMKYGKMKDWIEEIEFVDGRGDLIKTSKADLGDICGAEGITGIIVRLKLKVIPKPERSISIFQTDNLDEVLAISRRLKVEKDVVMLELFPPEVSEMLDLPRKYNLVIEFESDRGKIKGEEYERILNFKKKVYFALFEKGYYNIEDSKFFFDKLKEVMLYLRANNSPYFSYSGDGIIYSFFKDSEENKRKTVSEFMRKLGGKFVNGIGIKRKYFIEGFDRKVIQRVKLRHDPFGRLNKGKVIDFEPRVKDVEGIKHLTPLQKSEIEEIRPIVGEVISASEIREAITPEEEIQEFIEKVEMIEEKQEQEKPAEKELTETEKLIKDYEQTFESELAEERRKVIEDFAKNVPKEIGRKEIQIEEKKQDVQSEQKGKLSKEEQDLINKILGNRFNEDKKED